MSRSSLIGSLRRFFNEITVFLMWSLFMGLGAWCFYWGVTQEAQAGASRAWPSTQGRIISSYVDVTNNKGTSSYWPRVTYEYKVGDLLLEGDRVQFGQNGSARKPDAVTTVEKFPPGRIVPVFYNPRAPEISCLLPGKFESVTYVPLFFGPFLFLFGFVPLFWRFFVWWGKRTAKRP
jgi:hypothetical protein